MPNHIARALRGVPTVYFYLPNVKRQMGKGTGLVITDDVCAVLWLTELAAKDKNAAQASVRQAAGLSQVRMSTVLAALVPDFIESTVDRGNRRHHRLALTDRGHDLLTAIKEERATFLKALFKTLTLKQQAACANALTTLEETMWRAVQT
jgi:DNA-binding MarR family transcriptional regulator